MGPSKSFTAALDHLAGERFGGDDRELLATLVDQYQAVVFRVCMRFLGHQQDAEDLTQETFSRVIKHLDRWDRQLPIEPWIVTIAGNRCRSFLSARRQFRPLTPVHEPVGNHEDQARDAAQLSEELELALAALPQNHRTAFELFHDQHCSYERIAERMGHPVGTVKTWVHRARIRIIDQLRYRDVIESASEVTT